MRNKILLTTAAAFLLSTVATAPIVAVAQPTPAQMKKAGEIKDPAKADAAISKIEAKDAKKQAHRAHKLAKRAHHKRKVAAKKAEQAEKRAEKGKGDAQ
jgi:hypothetical protein